MSDSSQISQPIPVGAPHFYASNFNLFWNSNEMTLLLSALAPAISGDQVGLVQSPAAVISFSPQSGKDLLLLFQQIVGEYEAQFGEIETNFTRTRGADKVESESDDK